MRRHQSISYSSTIHRELYIRRLTKNRSKENKELIVLDHLYANIFIVFKPTEVLTKLFYILYNKQSGYQLQDPVAS